MTLDDIMNKLHEKYGVRGDCQEIGYPGTEVHSVLNNIKVNLLDVVELLKELNRESRRSDNEL